MEYDLSPGDVLHVGEAVTLTVVAVEDDRVRFELESPDGECPDVGPDGPRHRGWELN